LDKQFQEEIYRFEEEKKMPYVSGIERRALKRGREEGVEIGLLESIALDLKLKFGTAGTKLMAPIKEIHDLKQLRRLLRAIKSAGSLDEFKQRLG